MELSVFERLIIFNILPSQGNFTTLKTVRELKEAVGFDEDAEALDFHEGYECGECGARVRKPLNEPPGACHKCGEGLVKTGEMFWSSEADKPKEVEITDRGKRIIVDILEKLNDEEKLTNEHYTIYEKFCE